MCDTTEIDEYFWSNSGLEHSQGYLLRPILNILMQVRSTSGISGCERLFDLGCGNGSVASIFAKHGWDVTGVDSSVSGIAQARAHYPSVKLYEGSAYDDLAARYGRYPVVTSLEVVEHIYAPRRYAATLFDLLEPGGTAIISTPYHGYWKNLAMALSGKLDNHFTALWDHGHIKFWSINTLTVLLTETGFVDIQFERVGRVPVFAKSMIAIAKKPITA